MASSRIFIRGLPPTMNDDDFKKHFGAKLPITDSKLFPQRRIGYIGYKTPEDAAKAVKYFNRTFIRMSRIGVEIARPIQDTAPTKRLPAQRGQGKNDVKSQADGAKSTVVDGPNPLKRKREVPDPATQDPKLQEFLQVMQAPSKMKGLNSEALPKLVADSDSEYENIVKKSKRSKQQQAPAAAPHNDSADQDMEMRDGAPPDTSGVQNEMQQANEVDGTETKNTAISDMDWLRSRTTRLLGLVEEDEEERVEAVPEPESSPEAPEPMRGGNDTISAEDADGDAPSPEDAEDDVNDTEKAVRTSRRLYLRNLPYNVTEDDLRSQFVSYGALSEVHVPIDPKTGSTKGFAYLQFDEEDPAVTAWREMDGKIFQGRLLHVLPAAAKRETQLDDYALSKLPLKKQQQIKRKREAASSTFNWNALYMNADAVMSSVADRLGVSKSELLDPTSADAAVKQAHAETHIIQETKAYFKDNGVDLDAFKSKERGDTAILVKNFPYDSKDTELRRMFEEHGKLKRFLMPPTGTIAVVEYYNAPEARAAFASLAYRKVKNSVLFLEKAPRALFTAEPTSVDAIGRSTTSIAKDVKPSTTDLLQTDTFDTSQPDVGTATLFVRNLNFSTTTDKLMETFRPLDGFMSARVKTKTDAKKPGQVLSMGFGFLEFRSKAQAQAALSAMDGYTLDGHKLQLRASHKAADAAEERRREDKAKKMAARGTKVIIKNLPFEATKKDVRALFGAYGQLRSVRVPRKFDRGARGFAFADFTTSKEAESAMDALKDTHLLGRRLVLDFAAEDPEDAEAEIEKMQKKVGSQINKVALQKLTGAGRKKFNAYGNEEGDEA
ncbi:Multiple RNA-binding domain-containing protein 1 [Taxawa tesnikishii (nom. ined.)]|nr:Multiple RNA-binding domain-containing protein 1 [Dothideales sp. JES 119]